MKTFLGVVLLTAACGGSSTTPSKSVENSQEKNTSVPPTTTYTFPTPKVDPIESDQTIPSLKSIRLRNSGKGKKVALRYAIEKPNTGKFEVQLRSAKTRELKARKWSDFVELPTVRYGFTTQVKIKDDAFVVRWRGKKSSAESGTPAQVAAAQAVVANFNQHITGQRGEFPISALGKMDVMVAADASQPLPPRSKEEAENLIWQAVVPFPEEKVGTGAVWHAHSVLEKGDVLVKQQGKYTVKRIQGPVVTLQSEIRQVSLNQKVGVPGKEGEFLDLAGAVRIVKGEITVDTKTSVFPQGKNLTFEHRFHVQADTPQGKQDYAFEAEGTIDFLSSAGPRKVAATLKSEKSGS